MCPLSLLLVLSHKLQSMVCWTKQQSVLILKMYRRVMTAAGGASVITRYLHISDSAFPTSGVSPTRLDLTPLSLGAVRLTSSSLPSKEVAEQQALLRVAQKARSSRETEWVSRLVSERVGLTYYQANDCDEGHRDARVVKEVGAVTLIETKLVVVHDFSAFKNGDKPKYGRFLLKICWGNICQYSWRVISDYNYSKISLKWWARAWEQVSC